jgi:hypothetical protein
MGENNKWLSGGGIVVKPTDKKGGGIYIYHIYIHIYIYIYKYM